MRELAQYNENEILFYDVETAPVEEVLIPDTPLYVSWDYKVNKDGTKTEQEIIDSYAKEAGLYPEFAKIVCIIVGKIINGKIALMKLDQPDEKEVLSKFNELISRNLNDVLAGFVNIGFDAPFVFKRMIINGIAPHNKLDHSGLKPWEIKEIDLAMIWKGTSFVRASLINVATAFGLPSPKDDISGADVGRVYWSEGELGLKRISAYCQKDVVTTINVYRKMMLKEALASPNIVVPKEEEKVKKSPRSKAKAKVVATAEELVSIMDSKSPLIKKLFAGGSYGAAEKKELTAKLKAMDVSLLDSAFVVLEAMTSAAKGKKTLITKAQVKALRKEVTNG